MDLSDDLDELRRMADALLYTTQRSFDQYSARFTPIVNESVKRALARLTVLRVTSENAEALKNAIRDVERVVEDMIEDLKEPFGD